VSAHTVIHLDTTAPQVTWGPLGGATAGELLQQAYVSDEPIDRALLRLADGRELEMAVLADRLEVLLPADTPTGPGRISFYDELLNGGEYVIALAGAVTAVQHPPPRAGPPAGRGQVGTVTVRTRGQVGTVTARAAVGVEATKAVTAVASCAGRVRARPGGRSQGTWRSRAEVAVTARVRAARRLGVGGRTVRRDGPSIEEALLHDLI
jgi:hypothetical protein